MAEPIQSKYDFESKNFIGRRKIRTAVEKITDANLMDVLIDVLPVFEANRYEIEYLYNYYCGIQPILGKTKDTRPEINNKVVENHAYELVEFKNDQLFAEPIEYVLSKSAQPEGSDRTTDDVALSKEVALLNRYLARVGKPNVDYRLGEWFHSTGTAIRMTLPTTDRSERPFLTSAIDPRCAFVVYHSGFGEEPLMGVYITENEKKEKTYTVYTESKVYTVKETDLKKGQAVKGARNPLGLIPIEEYPFDEKRMSPVEVVMPLLDALNQVSSDRLDGLEQAVRSILRFVNVRLDDTGMKNLIDSKAVFVTSQQQMPGSVDFIHQDTDQSDIQVMSDDIYQNVLTISGMPNREGNTGGDTGEAVSKRNGWDMANDRAKKSEQVFKASEYRFLEVVLNILRTRKLISKLTVFDIDIKFTRQRNSNLLVKTQGLQNLLEAGVHPRLALSVVGLFSDSEEVYMESQEYMKKWLEDVTAHQREDVMGTSSNQKPNNAEEQIEKQNQDSQGQ